MTQAILVIDDSAETHELLEVRLKPEGVTLHRAMDAEEGLRFARSLRPDLILLDVDLPDMTGFEVCQRLKADPDTADLPIVFLTATTEVHSKVQGFDLGAVDYVTKPFQVVELRARVRAALRTKRLQDLLTTRAQLDGLTGIWNRAYFDQRLAEEVAATRRYARKLSLVLLDVDHFKSLNDDFGHPFGDLVLQRLGGILLGAVRATDAPCRYGGEEFALILGHTDADGAHTTADRLMGEIRKLAFIEKGQSVGLTVSMGIASSDRFSTPADLTAKSLLGAADDALFEAKRQGRNRICRAELAESVASGC